MTGEHRSQRAHVRAQIASAAAAGSILVAACAHNPAPPVTPTPAAGGAAAAASMAVPAQPAFRAEPLVKAWGPAPQGTAHTERTRTYDLQHQVVRVRFDWARHAVVGATTLTLAPLDTALRVVALDAVDMTFPVVTDASGRKLRHEYDGRTLTVHLQQPLARGQTTAIEVQYETVRPKQGAYFVDRNHYLWTQGETEANRYWIPTYDYPNDRLTWEFYVTTGADEKALSNGRLVGSRKVPGGIEWHWALERPASTYLMSVATGDYAVVADHWRDVPVNYWTYPDSVEAAKRGFGMTPRAIEVFSTKTGVAYPWAKYDQVTVPDFIFGGMENVTATTQSDDEILHPAWAEPQASASAVVAHELAHQWYGDLLTTRAWAHSWLNEGFATFMEQIFREADRGMDEGDLGRLGAQEEVFGADIRTRRPLVYDRWVADPLELFFTGHIYPKGATVLQMLRHQLGDSLFWAAMHRYTTDHMYENVVTADLQRAFEQATGRDLGRFFQQWVYGAGFPVFQVSYSWDPAARTLRLAAREVQPRDSATGFFDADVDVKVLTDQGTVRGVLAVRDSAGTFALTLPSAPRAIVWNDGGWLLDLADFPRPAAMLAYQLAHDDRVSGRSDAIAELARLKDDTLAVRALARALRDDPFRGVRSRAANALRAASGSDVAATALLGATRDADARVRQAVAGALGGYRGDAVAARLGELAQSDPSLFVRSAALQSLAQAAPERALALARPLLAQDSWTDVLRASALGVVGTVAAPEQWNTVFSYLSPANSRSARATALGMLSQNAKGHEAELARAVEPLVSDPDLYIRQYAAMTLAQLAQPTSLAVLQAQRKVELQSIVITTLDQAIAQLQNR